VLTVAGFLLMPLVGYSLAFLNSTAYAGFVSLICTLLLFFSQPVGSVNRSCIVGVVASVLNVLIPVAMCIYVGVGAHFVPLASLGICCTLVLPVIDMVVLWFSFFRKAVLHNAAWKNSLGWTIALRIASTMCGLGFLSMLFYDLSETQTKIAAGLWFAWVCLPFLSVIPLTAGVPSVLSAAEVVSSRKPLLGDIGGNDSPNLDYDNDDDMESSTSANL